MMFSPPAMGHAVEVWGLNPHVPTIQLIESAGNRPAALPSFDRSCDHLASKPKIVRLLPVLGGNRHRVDFDRGRHLGASLTRLPGDAGDAPPSLNEGGLF